MRITVKLKKVKGPKRLKGFKSLKYSFKRLQPKGERKLLPNRQVKYRVAENTKKNAYYYTATMRH